MYYTNDKKSYIKEIQKYLNVYADKGRDVLRRVPIDGIMGEKTKNAIRKFQRENGLSESGRVDRSTHSLLSRIFKNEMLLKSISKYVVTPGGFPLRINMQGNDVMALNIILEELGATYGNVSRVNRTRYFDRYTERAVKDLQKILGFSESGEVDSVFFDRLKRELGISNQYKNTRNLQNTR